MFCFCLHVLSAVSCVQTSRRTRLSTGPVNWSGSTPWGSTTRWVQQQVDPPGWASSNSCCDVIGSLLPPADRWSFNSFSLLSQYPGDGQRRRITAMPQCCKSQTSTCTQLNSCNNNNNSPCFLSFSWFTLKMMIRSFKSFTLFKLFSFIYSEKNLEILKIWFNFNLFHQTGSIFIFYSYF